MIYSFLLFIGGLFLFWIVSKKKRAPDCELPLSLAQGIPSAWGSFFRYASMLFFFLFSIVWLSSVLSLFFPAFSSHSLFLYFDKDEFEPKFSYSATMFIVDRSSSMKSTFDGSISRLDFAKGTVRALVNDIDREGSGHDTFGLMGCARIAPILVPMTRNRTFFFQKLDSLVPIEKEALNGTALGYALFKGELLLEALQQYAAKNNMETLSKKARSIVIITDGLEDVSPFDKKDPFRSMHMREALLQAKKFGIRVWYVVVAPPQQDLVSLSERKILFDLAASTEGGYVELLSFEDCDREMMKIATRIYDSQEKIQGGIDSQLLLGVGLFCMVLFLACMRVAERLGCRIG